MIPSSSEAFVVRSPLQVSVLLEGWPVDSDLVIDMETLPEALKVIMGEAWRDRKAYYEFIADKESEADEEAASD